jgi:hypothetical protein
MKPTSDAVKVKHDYRVTTCRPIGGLHPQMREFQCHACGKVYYRICSQKMLDNLARRAACGKVYYRICSQKMLDNLARRAVNNPAQPAGSS